MHQKKYNKQESIERFVKGTVEFRGFEFDKEFGERVKQATMEVLEAVWDDLYLVSHKFESIVILNMAGTCRGVHQTLGDETFLRVQILVPVYMTLSDAFIKHVVAHEFGHAVLHHWEICNGPASKVQHSIECVTNELAEKWGFPAPPSETEQPKQNQKGGDNG